MPKWKPYRFTSDRAWDDAPRLHADAVRTVQLEPVSGPLLPEALDGLPH